MQVVYSCLYHSTLALLLNCSFNLSSSLSDGFLYSRRMNTSVKYQLFKGHTRDFAPYRVKARKGYRFRCVIYYQINAGRRFERPYVASLTSDYASLHLIVRERHYRDGHFRRVVGGASLYRLTYNAFRNTVRIVLEPLLIVHYLDGFFVIQLAVKQVEQMNLCLFLGKA